MARERQQLWEVRKGTNLSADGWTSSITVTLELATVELETGEIIEPAPWRAVYTVASDEGRAAISDIRLEPIDPDAVPALPATLARELLRPGHALEAGRKGLLDMIDDPDVSDKERKARAEELARRHGLDATQLGTERRGKRQPDYFYAALAARYVEACANGSRRPNADVADQLPKPYKAPFVRDAVSKARARGLLERSAGQRRAGGALTTRGREVLQEGPPDDYVGTMPPA